MIPTALAGALADGITILSDTLMPRAMYCTVAYQDKDGNPLVEQLVIPGAASVEPDAPEYPTTDADDFTYVFSGWKSTVGNMATNNITDNVVFRPEYRKVESVAFVVNYKVVPAGAIAMPPSAVAYYEKGSVQDIYIKSPAVVGFKPDTEVVDLPNTTITAGMAAIDVTYTAAPEKTFTVKYYLEKQGIPMDAEIIPGNMAQFDLSPVTRTGSEQFGAVPAIEDIDPEGFTQLHKVYAPIDEGDNVYEVFYKRDAYYLSFAEGDTGDGNFYVEPLYLKYESPINWSAADIQPAQAGFTFIKWDLSTQYTNMPAKNLVAKATWTPSNTVPYTVVHWVEKPGMEGAPNLSNPNDFFLYKVEDKTNATAGSKLNASDQKIAVTVQGGTVDVPYAEYLGGDTNVTVKGDGSTIINVYYKRIAFEVVFDSADEMIKFPGTNSSTLTYYVKYEGDLGAYWPADEKEPFDRFDPNYKITEWRDKNGSAWNTKRTLFNAELLPRDGTTKMVFTAVWATAYEYVVEYYFEAYPDQAGNKVTFDQVAGIATEIMEPAVGQHAEYYIKDGAGAYSQKFAYSTENYVLTHKEIEGMDYHATKVLDPGDSNEPVTNRIIRLFYNRQSFSLSFNLIKTHSSIPVLPVITGIKYDEHISGYEPKQDWVAGVKPTFVDADQVRYTFGGWYADTECVTDFSFDQHMPFNDCVAYAKWVPDTVKVTFVSTEGAYNRTFTIAMGSSMGDAYPSGLAQVENVHGYQFDGWFLNGKPFPNTMPVFTDITVKAQYTPEHRSYTVKYQDTNGQQLAPTRTVSGYKYGNVITYPEMEKPLEIAGYSMVDGQSGSITLGDTGNEIIFRYVAFNGYKYQIEYRYENEALVTEANFQPNPAPVKTTSASQLLLWAKRDTTGKYYAVENYIIAEMSPNGTKTIVFHYAPYDKVKVQEQGILVGANDGYPIYDAMQADARIGQTVYAADTSTTKSYGGYQYKFVEGHPGTLLWAVADGAQAILLKRYYVQVCDYIFNVSGNGKLDFGGTQVTTKTFERLYGDAKGDITVPTPVPNDNNTYFAGWTPSEPSIPATITQGMTYTAEFKAKGTMTLKADSQTFTYDGTAKSAASTYTVLVNNVPTTEYTVSGVTVSGVTQTNSGTYTNSISGTPVIMKGSENVTGQFIVELVPGSLVINKRTITFTPKAISLPYNGQHQTAPTSYTISGDGLATGQVEAGVVVVGGGTATGTYTLSINASGISIHIGTAAGTDVSANYIISVGANALMTITTAGTKIPFTIAATGKTVAFSGNQVTTTWVEGTDWSIPGKSAIFPDTNGVFRITQTGSGTFNPPAPVEPRDYTITPPANFKVEWAETASGPWHDVTANYTMTPQTATLQVTQLTDGARIPLTVTAGSTTKTYNAQTQTHSGDAALRTTVDLLNGWLQGTPGSAVSVAAPFSGSGMEPDTYPVKFTNAAGSEAKITTTNGRAVDVTSNYNIMPVNGTLTITTGGGIPLTINVTNKTMAYTGKPFVHDGQYVYTVTSGTFPQSGADGTIEVRYTIDYDTNTVAPGTYPGFITLKNFQIIRVKGGVDTDITGNYTINFTGGNLTITGLGGTNRLLLEIKPNDESVYYTGSTQTVNRTTGQATVKVDGVTNPSNYRVEFNAQGSGKTPGTYPINVNNNWADYKVYYTGGGSNDDVTANYRIANQTPGDFTIKACDGGPGGEKPTLIVTPNTVTKPFTGLPQTVGPDGLTGTFTITGIANPVAEGFTVTFTANGSGTYPGSYPIVVNNASIKVYQDGKDVTSSFTCSGSNGNFIISVDPGNKPVIVITPKTITKAYNGGALVEGETTEFDVLYGGGSSLPSGLTITMKAKGEARSPGANKVVEITELTVMNGTQNASDWYTIQKETGILFLSDPGSTYTLEITPDPITKYFNATQQTVTQNQGTILINGIPYNPADPHIRVEFQATASGLMPGKYELEQVPGSVHVWVDGVDATDFYSLTFNPEYFTILSSGGGEVSLIPITIRPETIRVMYTGQLIERTTSVGTVTVLTKNDLGQTYEMPIEQTDLEVTWAASGSGVVPETHPLYLVSSEFKVIEKSTGLNVTGNFSPRKVGGYLIIEPRPENDLLEMVITPASDLTRKYTGSKQTFDPTQATPGSTVTVGGVSITDSTRGYEKVDFTAHGEGTADGNYDVIVQNQPVKVMLVGDPHENVWGGPSDVTSQYKITYATGTLRINSLGAGEKLPLYIRPDDATLAYTGLLLTTDATSITGGAKNGYLWHGAMGTPLPGGLTVQFAAHGEGIAPKTYDIDFTKNASMLPDIKVIAPEKDVTHNYTLMNEKGVFTITPLTGANRIELSITPKKETYQYTGETIHADGTQNATGTGGSILHGGAALPSTLKVEYAAKGQGLLPGTYTGGIALADTPKTTWKVTTTAGDDVTDNYTLKTTPNDLIITDRGVGNEITITVRPMMVEQLYTGSELTASTKEYEYARIDGMPISSNLILVFTAKGTGIANGDHPLTIDGQTFKVYYGSVAPENEVTKNYKLDAVEGIFRITPRDASNLIPLYIKPNDVTKMYDGTLQTITVTDPNGTVNHGTPTDTLPSVLAVTFTGKSEGRFPDTYDILVANGDFTVKVPSEAGKDVTRNYKLVPVAGAFVITDASPKLSLDVYPGVYTYLFDNAQHQVTLTSSAGMTGAGSYVKLNGKNITELAQTVVVTFTASSAARTQVGTEDILLRDAVNWGITIDGVQMKNSYELNFINGQMVIEELGEGQKIPLEITPTGLTVPFDGNLHTHTDTGNGVVKINGSTNLGGVTVAYTATASGTSPGSYKMVVDVNSVVVRGADGSINTSNYALSVGDAYLVIEPLGDAKKIPLHIQPKDMSKPYNGHTQSVMQTDGTIGYGAVGTPAPAGLTITFEATGQGQAPDTYDINCVEGKLKVIVTATGADVTDQYKLVNIPGKFQITPLADGAKIALAIRPGDRKEEYRSGGWTISVNSSDANALVPNGYIKHGADGDTLPSGIQVTFAASSAGLAVGTYDIDVTSWNITAVNAQGQRVSVKDQYKESLTPGVFEITPLSEGSKIKIVIQPIDRDDLVYTGAEQSVTVTTGTITVDGMTLAAYNAANGANLTVGFTANGKGTVPHIDYQINVDIPNVTVKNGTANVKENFTIEQVSGTLRIQPLGDGDKILLIVTANNASREYTGVTQTVQVTAGTITDASKVPAGYALSLVSDGSGRAPDTYPMTYQANSTKIIVEGVDVAENYAITEKAGSLTITAVDHKIPLVIKPHDKEYTFNGQMQYAPKVADITFGTGLNPADHGMSVDYDIHGEGIAIGNYSITVVDGTTVVMQDGKNVTDNFLLQPGTGELTIVSSGTKIPLHIIPDSRTEAFTGNTVSVNVTTGTITLNGVSYSQTDPNRTVDIVFAASGFGLAPTDYPINLDATSVEVYAVTDTQHKLNLVDEYKITTAPGKLTITYDATNKGTIHIKPNPASLYYTGLLQTATVTEGTITVNGVALNTSELEISFKATGSGQAVGTYDNITVDMNSIVIKDKISGLDISTRGYYAITAETSVLTIKKRTGGEEDPKLELRIKPVDQYRDYTGAEQTVTVTEGSVWVDNVPVPQSSAGGINVAFTATGKGTSTTGSPYPITLTPGSVSVMIGTEDMIDNYTVKQDDAWLYITGSGSLLPVTITPTDQSLYYNGKTQTVTVTTGDIKINGQPVPAGTTVTFSATGSGDVPQGYPIVIDPASFSVTVGGSPETANYKLFPTNGTLTINPLPDAQKIPIELTIPGDSSIYTGEVQTSKRTQAEATAIEVGMGANKKPIADLNAENGNTLAVAFVANAKGLTPDDYPFALDGAATKVTLNGKDVTGQYAVTLNPAKFTITALPDGQKIPLKITPDNVTKPYTGALQTVTSNTGTVLIGASNKTPAQAGVTVTFSAQGQGIDPTPTAADRYPINVVDNTVKVMVYDSVKGQDVDVTANYEKMYTSGWFTITALTGNDRIPVYITPNDKAVPYTGYAQTVHQDVGAIEVGPGRDTPTDAGIIVAFDAQGTGTDPGSYPMVITSGTFSVTSALGNKNVTSSYVLVPTNGTLEITKLTGADRIPLRITPNYISKDYTGLPQQVTVTQGTFVHGVNTGLPPGITVAFTATGEATDIGLHDTIVQPGTTVKRGTADLTENYEILPNKGVFEIKASLNKPLLYIKPADAEDWYTGGTQTATVHTGTILIGGPSGQPLPAGTTVTFTATGTGQAVGTYPISVTAYEIKDSSGTVVTDQYRTQFATGTYTIKQRDGVVAPLIQLKITPEDAARNYTGQTISVTVNTPAPVNGILMDGAAPPAGVTVTFTATGSGLAQGTYPIDVNPGWKVMAGGKDMSANYTLVIPSRSTLTINALTGTNKIKLSITPDNRQDTYTGNPLSTGAVTAGTIRMNNAAKPAHLDVSFTAEGHGLNSGTYPIDVDAADGMWSVMHGTTNVSTNYVLDPHPGTFTIRQASIPITVSMSDPAPAVYNGQNQTTNPATYVVHYTLAPDPGLTVTIDKAVTGKDAKDYPINFTKDNVKIMIGTENVTRNYVITVVPGAKFTIKPKPLGGSVTVNNPGGPYVYGDRAQNWTPGATEAITGLEPGDKITYTISRDLDSKDVGSYMFDITPDNLKNPNYDTMGIAWNGNGPMVITPAPLTATANEVWVAQNSPEPSVYPYAVTGYQYGENMAAVGPNNIVYGMMGATSSDPIGTQGSISKVTGDTALTNYTVTYVGNTFGVYGEVLYHSNYPSGTDVVVPYGEYHSQADMPIAPSYTVLGFGLEDLRFEEWTKDAAGTDPYPAAGEPIGPQSINLYAQWIPQYKLTIQHQDIGDDSEIAPSETLWLLEDTVYTIEAKEIDKYEPVYLRYLVDGVEAFTGTITLEEGVELTMPDKPVEAFIYYRKQALPPLREIELPSRGGGGYLLPGEDIPLAGVCSLNRGICFE